MVSVYRIAEREEVSPSTVWRWVRNGDFPQPVRLSPGCTRWRLEDVERWESERGAA
ncbi:AlpA family transcriptional regulator [Thioalkalivibrio sp. ALMg3]|uniref:helix-turn-helix transcriptional regulator n=1 Tax=Thioalkalivibrio sp. ALMg3 TaxID=1158163 RepID=UPI001E4B72C2|nr:AlpA family phage regulatory protein [Thioalkalivibrio sp. ALMg3]